MKTLDSVPLTGPDVAPFHKKEVAVRLFKNGRWYAGIHHETFFDETFIKMYLWQFLRFWHPEAIDPTDPGSALFTDKDKPLEKSFRENERAFILKNPRKLIGHGYEPDVLIISFDDGIAILSTRGVDIDLVKNLFKTHDSPPPAAT
jgi:hypothetical protein